MLALPPLSCPVPSRPHLGNGVTLTAESHCESLLRLGGAGGVGMARSALWVGSVVRGTFAWWRGRGRCRPPCDLAAVSRGADPLFSGPRLPWAPGPGASDPTHAIGCPGLLWGGDTPRRGPCPQPEPDPTPLSPFLPWALTFGLGCVPLCTVQVDQESCQVCSAGTPLPCVSDGLLTAGHPALSTALGRLVWPEPHPLVFPLSHCHPLPAPVPSL